MEQTGRKKGLVILLGTLAVLAVILAAVLLGRGKAVGRITGPEWDHLELDGVSYARCDTAPYAAGDKGEFLGLAAAGEETFRLYAVKGDEEREYIYCFWDWEGFFYQKE